MAFKLRSGNKTTFKEMGSSSLKQNRNDAYSKGEFVHPVYGRPDFIPEDTNIIPEVEISTLSDESYDKLSDAQKQVYDAFGGDQTIRYTNKVVPEGRTIRPVRRESELHWEDALRMVEDSGVENIYNTPKVTRDASGKEVVNHPMDSDGIFRAHAWIPFDSGGNIFIPSAEAWDNAYHSDTAKEKYISKLAAELGHLRQRDIYNKDVEGGGYRGAAERTGVSRRARAKLEGRTPDVSNYRTRADYEMQTHTGAKGGESTMFDEYSMGARLRRMYPSLFRKNKK